MGKETKEELSASQHLSRLLVMMSAVLLLMTFLFALLGITPWESKDTQGNLFISGVIGGIGILIYATGSKQKRKNSETNE